MMFTCQPLITDMNWFSKSCITHNSELIFPFVISKIIYAYHPDHDIREDSCPRDREKESEKEEFPPFVFSAVRNSVVKHCQ